MVQLAKARYSISTALLALYLVALPACAQDSGDESTMGRGDHAEISVTVRNAGGELIVAPGNVKLYQNGVPTDQSSISHGRAFFIPRTLGNYTIVVEAVGYKSAQKEVSLTIPIKEEIDIYLQAENASNVSVGVPGKPILAPKAKEAVVKALQALSAGMLDEAQKYMNQAMKLAPGHPEVLYVQGMVYMKRSNWAEAATVLEKSDQLGPNDPRVLSALGMTLCDEKKYDQAIPVLEKSVKLQPTATWETDWALGRSYYSTGKYEQALTMAQQARNGSPGSNPQAELLLAQCLAAVQRYEESAQVLRDFLKKSPDTPDAATARRWLDGLVANGKIRPQANTTP